ncbi:C4-dicarboxylate transporter/malic acid transport protein [Ceraceosorus guamensis]|uniref:C4-dicarboxylate transporter/malic acid transport protein n=1 Tax=Ceraceosorus guamensis TaxID=1522189 RepID=A0A316VQ73_9BASI|nr:C4-dicarboxylate transporter/malic acid transport protein [Ceraceosorus guamensis]PWN39218.1 C4-dicarboxylate transporter/malic acid transport protein [Ceraceosorus guamensis]
MGTGGVHILLLLLADVWSAYASDATADDHQSFASNTTLPAKILRWPALIFWIVNCALFFTFLLAFISRYIMFPAVLPLTLTHPQKSPFLGTAPMAFLTLISSLSQLGTRFFALGLTPTILAASLWFVACFVSTLCALVVPFSMMILQNHHFEGTTAALLLPVVPPITAAATGAGIAELLAIDKPSLSFTVLALSYIMNGVGLMLALMILTLYFQRLLLFNQPPREVIISVFLPLGPCGQGAEALLHLGQAALRLFPVISSLALPTPGTGHGDGVPLLTYGVAQALYGAGLVGALHLVGLGGWFCLLAIAIVFREATQERLKFNLGFWAATFPLASLIIGVGRLALVLDSLAIRVVFTLMCFAYALVYFGVAVPTLRGFISAELLVAPCIADLPLDPLKKYRDPRDEVEER